MALLIVFLGAERVPGFESLPVDALTKIAFDGSPSNPEHPLKFGLCGGQAGGPPPPPPGPGVVTPC